MSSKLKKHLRKDRYNLQWIPCSKELPERNLVVLVTTRWGEVTEGVKLSGNEWFIGRGEENAFDSDIIAWMPKPEPYAESRKENRWYPITRYRYGKMAVTNKGM